MTKLKMTLALLGAFSAGCGLGAVGMRQYLKAHYETMAQKAIQEARVALIKRTHKDTSKEVDGPQKASDSEIEGVSEVETGFDEFGRQTDAPDFNPSGYLKYHAESPDVDKPSLEDLALLRKDPPEPDDDGSEYGYDQENSDFTEDFTRGEVDAFEEDAPRLDGGERDGDPSGRAPYIITEHEYIYGDRSFSKVCMTYYTKDKVLCDDDGSPVNVDSFVGRKAIAKAKEDDAVYVRNERFGIDIEVVALDGWFNEPGEGDD